MKIIAPNRKLITRRGLLRVAGIAAPAILLDRPAAAQFGGCLPGLCNAALSGPADPFFSNVILQDMFQGPNGSTTTVDQSPLARGVATVAGTAKLSSAQAIYGISSALFTGGAGKFSWGANANAILGTSWTIEVALRWNVAASVCPIAQYNGNGGGDVCWFLATNTDQWNWSVGNGAGGFPISIVTPSPTYVINTWYQACFESNGILARVYKDGTMIGSQTPSTTFASNPLTGTFTGQDQGGHFAAFDGYMGYVRITKNVARYNTNGTYTLPTLPFPTH